MFGCWWAVLLKLGSSFSARTTNAHVALAKLIIRSPDDKKRERAREDDVVFLIGCLYSLLVG
jgi:hypothetical protein